MIDPFSYWSRAWAASAQFAATGLRLSETIDASRVVIASRSDKIDDAVRSPWTGDYAEFSRMMPEKVAAFSLSGNVAVRAWFDMEAAWRRQLQPLGVLVSRGRAPTPGEILDLWLGGAEEMLLAFEAAARVSRDMLAPVHTAATANRRRLISKAKPRRG